ncbi:MAG: T9SS type A sorting domain-containing protein [Bacteroidetes bacterium]|nr:T9SS type A sorting domain-containing protein [Bacteroidota bacterium]
MKKIIFMGFCLFSLVSSSQSLERSVVAVSGNYYEQPGTGSLSFTLGEIAVATLNSTGNFLTQGFQQPDTSFIDFVYEKEAINGFTIYPNPVADVLTCNINSEEKYLFSIADGGGRLVDVPQITQGFQVFLNVRSLAPGIYFLSILNNTGKRIATRQFVKP